MLGRGWGWAFLVGGLAGCAAGLLLVVLGARAPAAAGVGRLGGAWVATTGLLFVVLGVLVLLRPGRPPVPDVPAPAPPEPVEIKRTEMRWDENRPPVSPDPFQAQRDDVERRKARLKVRYGMGELSDHSYRALMTELEAEELEIERRGARSANR